MKRIIYIEIGIIYLSHTDFNYLDIQFETFILAITIGMLFFITHIVIAKGIKLTKKDCNKGFIKTCIIIYLIELPAEEFLYRGILLISLTNLLNPTLAIIISSIIFGTLHIKTWNDKKIWIASFILGLTCAISGILTKSIWIAIIIHNLNNFAYLALINK